MSANPDIHLFRILLVEDNQADIYLIRRAFKISGLNYELEVIDNGADAVAFFRNPENYTHGGVDLVVLDINLPRESGIEVLAAIRSSRDLHIPVAIASSSSSSRDRAKMEQLGVERFFTKGPNLDDFLNFVAELKTMLEATGKRQPVT